MKPKRELIRVVRGPDGKIYVDETGKSYGRGAYLCRDRACWEKGISGSRLAYSLKATLSEVDCAHLLAYARQLPATGPEVSGHQES